MLPSSGHSWKLSHFCSGEMSDRDPLSSFFSLRAAFFTLPLVPGFVETHFQMCQSHSMSWSRISVFQLLSKIEEILRKENVSPQPPGSSAQRPSMLWCLPLSSAMCLRGNRPQTDRDGFDVSRFFPFLSPDNSEHHCVTQHGTAWKGTYRFSPSHTSMWQQSYPRDDRQHEWEIRELTPSSEEPARATSSYCPSVSPFSNGIGEWAQCS